MVREDRGDSLCRRAVLVRMRSRFSVLAWVFPGRFIENRERWRDFDLESWSAESYEWVSDGPGLWRDRVRYPSDTVSGGKGDCDDYAVVAASWARSNGRSRVGLAVCGHTVAGFLVPTHMVAVDSRRVYSSGEMYDLSPLEYVEMKEAYTWIWPRYVI